MLNVPSALEFPRRVSLLFLLDRCFRESRQRHKVTGDRGRGLAFLCIKSANELVNVVPADFGIVGFAFCDSETMFCSVCSDNVEFAPRLLDVEPGWTIAKSEEQVGHKP
jgi:hypothetical protein